jgi:hypothetical protein
MHSGASCLAHLIAPILDCYSNHSFIYLSADAGPLYPLVFLVM